MLFVVGLFVLFVGRVFVLLCEFMTLSEQVGVVLEDSEPRSRASRTPSKGEIYGTSGISTRAWGYRWMTHMRTTAGTKATTLWPG